MSTTTKPNLVRFATLMVQLSLFLFVVYRFNLDSRAFLHVSILTVFAFAVHYFLPMRLRMPFFALVSLASVFLVYGFRLEDLSRRGLMQGAWLIALGLGLIAIAHLPIAFRLRVVLMLAVALVLALLRGTGAAVPWSAAIWPILGSMFMFRMILYLHELRHEKEPASIATRISYFFMLPNICFPLFPVVDYSSFKRSWFVGEDHDRIYQVGVHWIFRGLVQLLLYRLVYQNFVLDASEVESVGDLVQFLLWPFLLYLRVSGYFHLIVGMLHLFGFNLGETHRLYYLSSSFTDFWRRINIYWKDFMMKIFFYPAYLRLKKIGETPALVLTTLFIFFLTWVLHAYQWFWIRGTFLLTWNDGLFWLVLGILVVFNSLYEINHGRQRRLKGQSLPWRTAVGLALRTIAIFVTISILWSFWSAASVGEWLSAWGAGLQSGDFDLKALVLIGAVVVIVGGMSIGMARGMTDRPWSFAGSATVVVTTAVVLLVISEPAIFKPLGPVARRTVTSMKTSELNQRDFAKMERGYYENLIDVGSFNPELWEVYRTKPPDWKLLRETEAVAHTDGFPYYVLRPSIEVRHHGVVITTNSLGLRDREYSVQRPPDTFRAAIVGSSFVFGSGVESEDVFEAKVEADLNRDNTSEIAYELLNFGVAGYSVLEHLVVLENRIFEFEPNAVLYFEHANALGPTINHLAQLIKLGGEIPYEFLEEIIDRSGIDRSQIETTDHYLIAQSLRPFGEEILSWAYQRMVSLCEEQGVPAVWIYLPRPEKKDVRRLPDMQAGYAREAGFLVLDLTDVYGDVELSSIWVARWDHHPDAVGHQMIADGLLEALQQNGILPSSGETREPTENATDSTLED